jgi:hypothetical protein
VSVRSPANPSARTRPTQPGNGDGELGQPGGGRDPGPRTAPAVPVTPAATSGGAPPAAILAAATERAARQAAADAEHAAMTVSDNHQRALSIHLTSTWVGDQCGIRGVRAGLRGWMRYRAVLVPAASASPPPSERVLELLTGLLQVTAGLIGPALGLQSGIAGEVADTALDTPARFLRGHRVSNYDRSPGFYAVGPCAGLRGK